MMLLNDRGVFQEACLIDNPEHFNDLMSPITVALHSVFQQNKYYNTPIDATAFWIFIIR